MIEGWIIQRTPNFPFTVRHFYGIGRTRVFAQGAAAAFTLDDARDVIPKGRGLVRLPSNTLDVVELWVTPAAIVRIRAKLSVRLGAP